MLLEHIGPEALLCPPATSTPCMEDLLYEPSDEIGGRGNLYLVHIFSSFGGEEAAQHYTTIAIVLKPRAHMTTHKSQRRGCYGNTSLTTHHDAQTTVRVLTNSQIFSFVEVRALRGVCPWLPTLIDDLTYTTDAYQLNRLRTAECPTGLIFTNGRCSLLYMNGCELATFECCIHHAFGEESMAAPSTYRTVQGL